MENADRTILIWINGWVGRSRLFDSAAEWVVSDYLIPVCLALLLLGLWFSGSNANDRYRYQVSVLSALVAMAIASWIVMMNNWVYFRPRPFETLDVVLLFYEPTDSSFPANTSAATFAISTTIWLVNRRLGVVALVMSGLFGLARIYAGVHYPSDIIVGGFVGALISLAVARLMSTLEIVPRTVIRIAKILCLA